MQLRSTGQTVFPTGHALTLGTRAENNIRTYEEVVRPFRKEERCKTKRGEVMMVLSKNLKKGAGQ